MNLLRKYIKINYNKKGLAFLYGIAFIGFIFGIIFLIIISKSDKVLVSNYLGDYFKNINNSPNYFELFKNSFFNNLFFILFVWILGISMIGIPINIFYYFIKSFIIGFTISSFIMKYHLKGCFLSLIYVIPHNIINITIFTVLCYYSINFSFSLIYILLKKKSINLKPLFNRYTKILIISLIIITLTSAYESIVLPIIYKKILLFMK